MIKYDYKKYAAVLLLAVLFSLQGCATVQPWERGTLARQDMAISGDALEAGLNQHIYFAKEASSGGLESGGGGCGCN